MKKILYLHGAFSAFKPESEKVIALQKDFNVVGFSYSMEKTFNDNITELEAFCIEEGIEAVVGVSLGGLYASWLAELFQIPSILINPCVDPAGTISILIGEHTNFTTNKTEHFTRELANSFPKNTYLNKSTLVCVGMKDDIIDPSKTLKMAREVNAQLIINDNEDHYWEFFSENETIKQFLQSLLCLKNLNNI